MDDEELVGFDALYEAMWKCKRGTIWKNPVAGYVLHGIEETLKLEEKLKTGKYKSGKTNKFILTYPKVRECVSICFRDRIYQRSLNDNAIYPQVTKHFIWDNMACQRRKGTDKAMDRLERFLHEYYRKNKTNEGYVLQGDIEHYYASMTHKSAKDTFREYVDDVPYKRAEVILDNQYDGDRGYNPGSQMIQIAGISVPNKTDHKIKEAKGERHYLRYMDDFIIIHDNYEYLEEMREIFTEELKKIDLKLHPKKTRIYPLADGILFLGFTFKLTQTGKVIRLINPQNVKHERKRLRRMVAKAKRGEMTKAKVDECYNAWKAHAKRGNTWKLLKRMDNYYNQLWRNDYESNQKLNADQRKSGIKTGTGTGREK